MSCDMFSSVKARDLLKGKTICLFGDSNMRALYKDLLWLLEDGRLIPNRKLRCKNETSHANDIRLSNGKTHGGRHYKEVRSYDENPYVLFHFITRLYLPDFINTIQNLKHKPDVVAINSCVWDLTRWGSNGVQQFKQNVKATFSFLKTHLPSTRIIWLTTLPPSFTSRGGFLTKEIEFLRNMLPWHIMFANKYASDVALSYFIDVLDLHYNFRFLLNYHTKDGIHWDPQSMRYATNLLLTHIALCWNRKLPGRFELDRTFVKDSECISNSSDTKTNETKEQKPLSNTSHNSSTNKSSNTIPKKSTRKRKSQNTPHKNSSSKYYKKSANHQGVFRPLINLQLDGGGFNAFRNIVTSNLNYNQNMFPNCNQPTTVWHEDYPINNFKDTVFMFGNNHDYNYHSNMGNNSSHPGIASNAYPLNIQRMRQNSNRWH